jgi:hypothetical protein
MMELGKAIAIALLLIASGDVVADKAVAQQSGLAPAPAPPPPPEHTTVLPGMITPGSVPGTPDPPHNPSQRPLPSAPGVVVTIPIGRK